MFLLTFFVRITFYYSSSLLKKNKTTNPSLFHSRDIIICKRLFPARGGAGLFFNLHFISGVRLGRGVGFLHFLGLIQILNAAAAILQALTSERNKAGVFMCTR